MKELEPLDKELADLLFRRIEWEVPEPAWLDVEEEKDEA
jgi:hypothetical protein